MSDTINITDVGGYILRRTLGTGSFGKVKIAVKKNEKQSTMEEERFAVKILEKKKVLKDEKATEQLKREISSMRMVRHPNVVHLHEVFASKTRIYLVMDLMEGGELSEEMKKNPGKRFKADKARTYFQQLIHALDYCHSRGVFHRDLKPENILLDSQGTLKVADFGLSALVEHRFLGADNLLRTWCGTPYYAAPEVHKHHAYDGEKADVWSCGVILYEMITGKLPFLKNTPSSIITGKFKIPEWMPNGPKKLIKRLLDPDPAQRITISEILVDRWFKKGYPHASMPKQEEIVTNDAADLDYVFDGSGESSNLVVEKREKQPFVPPQLDAFQLIAEAERYNIGKLLTGRFFLDRVGRAKTDRRLFFNCQTGDILAKIKAAATSVGLVMKGKNNKEKEENEFMLMLEADAPGKKGLVSIKTNLYKVGETSKYLVLLSKYNGDSLEYSKYCSDLAVGLEGVLWETDKDKDKEDEEEEKEAETH